MTRKVTIDMRIDASKYTAHTRPGKFEGESPATEYFYDQMCEGEGEAIYSPIEGDDSSAELFHVSVEEAEAFGLETGAWFLLREDSQGFAIGSVHATREDAEKHFAAWLGIKE